MLTIGCSRFTSCSAFVRPFLIILGAKAVYIFFLIILAENSQSFNLQNYQRMLHWPLASSPTLMSHFSTWDAAHYLNLAEIGYVVGKPSNAFYPLWPFLIRAFSDITSIDYLISGLFLSNLFSAAAGSLFYLMLSEMFPDSGNSRHLPSFTLFALFLFPGSLFLQFPYSESVFLFLLFWLIRAARQNALGATAICAAFLPLTRPVGVFIILPVAFEMWTVSKWRSMPHDSRASEAGLLISDSSHPCVPLLVIISALFGWLTYFALMWYLTGNPVEGFDAQEFWGVNSIWNFINLPVTLTDLASIRSFHRYDGSFLDRLMFILMLFAAIPITRKNRVYTAWLIALVLIPGLLSSYTSFCRYAALGFPLFILLGEHMAASVSRRIFIIALLGGGHAFLLWRHINFNWAG